MADVTPGELYRTVQDLKADVRERDAALGRRVDDVSTDLSQRIDNVSKDLSQRLDRQGTDLSHRLDRQGTDLSQRLDRQVSLELFNTHLETDRREKDELQAENAELRAALDKERERRSTDRRLVLMALFTAVLAPLFFLLLNTVLRTKGAAP